jgi:hypothetical protein
LSSPRGDDETRCDELSSSKEVTRRVRRLLDGSGRRISRADDLLASSARRIELSEPRLLSPE